MNRLSFKDTAFIIEALDCLLKRYNERLTAIANNKVYQDEAADLGNDCIFLAALKAALEESFRQWQNQPTLALSQNLADTEKISPFSWSDLAKLATQFPIDERRLLIERITASIHNEQNEQSLIVASTPK